MSNYLPIIISAIVIFTALMWWLLALGNVKKGGVAPEEGAPRKAVPAPPVAAAPPPAAPKVAAPGKLMDDPKPAARTAAPKAQPPLKAAATKAAPTKAAAPKIAAPKPAATKVSTPKAPVAATPKVAAPKPKATAKPPVPDNLLLLKGVGPKVNTLLASMGVTSFEQVANWSAADIAEIDPKLGAFAGRISRDNWVDQARFLASGDIAGFEKKYGALGSEPRG